MHWDIKQDLSVVIGPYTSRERLNKIIQDNENFADNRTQHNEGLNGTVIGMDPTAIKCATTVSFSDRVHHIIG
eukprot:456639-Ditylum_brightwellii.AAC.1